MGCSPSGSDCSSVGPPQGHKSFQKTCSGIGSSVHGSTSPGRSLLQHGLPTASFEHPPALAWGPPRAASGDLLHHGPPWAAGTACLTMVCLMGCRGTAAPALGTHPPPPLLTLVSAELFLSIFSLHFSDCYSAVVIFPLLKYVITEVLPPLLMGLGQQQLHLGAGWSWLYQT